MARLLFRHSLLLVDLACRKRRAKRQGCQTAKMILGADFTFDIGVTEKHHVRFRWGQWWGLARITVDGLEVLRERHNFGPSIRRYEVSVGESEVHSVVIEKVRPFNDIFAGFSKMTFRLIVDGDLVAEYE
jgi:hypothetical protein